MSSMFNTTSGGSGRDEDRGVHAARASVAGAVLQMQGELQQELQEDQLHIVSVLGRGGFGTVYHGAPFVRMSSRPAAWCLACA
jgi:hypothetical protein